jgi:hypothetical protein
LYHLAETEGWICSVLAGLGKAMKDYSKAYDKVWRQDLIHDLLDEQVRLIRAFLTDRTAQVRYNGTYSKREFMRQGLPQGAVSSLLLFLFYINSLHEIIPEKVELALFADDASIWSLDPDINRANDGAQAAQDSIQE